MARPTEHWNDDHRLDERDPTCDGPVQQLYVRRERGWLPVGWACMRCGAATIEVEKLPELPPSTFGSALR